MWKCSSGSLRLFRNAGQYRTMAETPAKLPTASLAPIPTVLLPIHRVTGADQFRPDRAAVTFAPTNTRARCGSSAVPRRLYGMVAVRSGDSIVIWGGVPSVSKATVPFKGRPTRSKPTMRPT